MEFYRKNSFSENPSINKNVRTVLLGVLLAIALLFYTIRLFSMQVIQGAHYRSQSRTISSQTNILPAQRGEIFDCNAEQPMVVNTDSFAVTVSPGEIPEGHYDTVATKLASYLGISKRDIDKRIPSN